MNRNGDDTNRQSTEPEEKHVPRRAFVGAGRSPRREAQHERSHSAVSQQTSSDDNGADLASDGYAVFGGRETNVPGGYPAARPASDTQENGMQKIPADGSPAELRRLPTGAAQPVDAAFEEVTPPAADSPASSDNRRPAPGIRQATYQDGTPVKTNTKRRKTKGSDPGTTFILSFIKWLAYAIFIIGTSIALAAWGMACIDDAVGLTKDEGEIVIDIPEGATISDVTDMLSDAGVIRQPFAFRVFCKIAHRDNTHKYGKYAIDTSWGYLEITNAIRQDSTLKDTIKVTVPEGYELREIAALLEKNGVCSSADFMDACQNGDWSDYQFLNDVPADRENRLEGYLFPDTYEFFVGEEPADAVARFLDNFNSQYTAEMLDRAQELGMTFDQVITLASVIEREAAGPEDAPLVSSVFHNRLDSDEYPYLQSCATVQYILEERKAELTVEDTEIDNPYNTYMYRGLPPGPIASPGLTSINAALWPEDTDYYFFVVNADGVHVFSETYEEHLEAVANAGTSSQGTGIVGDGEGGFEG